MPYTKIVGARVRSAGITSAPTNRPAPKNRSRLAAPPITSTYPRAHEDTSIPELTVGEEVIKQKLDTKQSFTEPPPRYTEASLVKALEEKGIGRPSTYSPTITTILARRYIEKVQKQIHPTELGKIVNKLLIENFKDVINVEFTAQMEEKFDKIADRKRTMEKCYIRILWTF